MGSPNKKPEGSFSATMGGIDFTVVPAILGQKAPLKERVFDNRTDTMLASKLVRNWAEYKRFLFRKWVNFIS
jgi:hypothetical protein